MIYFMQCINGGPVKIGFTDSLDARKSQLESHYGVQLAVLATRDGGIREEYEVHARFAHLRFGRTEQFKPAAELMDFIGGDPSLVSTDVVEMMPARPRTLRPNEVILDHALLRRAKYVAEYRGLTIAEYLSAITGPIVDRDMQAIAAEMLKKPLK